MKGSHVSQISAVVIGLAVAGSAIAWGGYDGEGHRGESSRKEHRVGWHEKSRGGCDMVGDWSNREHILERELDADQVQTLAEARLIMLGNENLKVGTVKTTEDGYSVSIVTKKSGDLVRTMELAKNGLPMRMMERIEERENSREK